MRAKPPQAPHVEVALSHICKVLAHRQVLRKTLVCLVLTGSILMTIFTLAYSPVVTLIDFREFRWPLDIDLVAVVDRHWRGQSTGVAPINVAPFSLISQRHKSCATSQTVILIKSVLTARRNRNAIRATWAHATCIPSSRVSIFFILGRSNRTTVNVDSTTEQAHNRDLLQFDFVDAYFNNTHKLLRGIDFVVSQCTRAQFVVFVDDDYLVNPQAMMRYLDHVHPSVLPRFIAGFVYYQPLPNRKTYEKWYVSEQEYPYNFYPPYVTGGTMMMSVELARNVSVASRYVKYFRLDDIFLAIVLFKLLILPIHTSDVYFNKPTRINSTIIATHGYRNASELIYTWSALSHNSKCLVQR